MSWQRLCIIPAVLCFFLVMVLPAYAVSVNFTGIAEGQVIQVDQEVPVTVSVDVSSATEATLRVFFTKKNATTNYFGCSSTGAVKGCLRTDGPKDYPTITGGTTGVNIGIIADSLDTGYKGPGEYYVKVGRCTSESSCAYSASISAVLQGGSSSPTPSSAATNIVISEIYACANTGEGEWVELLNDHDTDVTLSNWKMKDNAGHSKTITSLTIPKRGYEIVSLSDMLNNDGDTVELVNESGTTIDKKDFLSCANYKGTSWATIGSKWLLTTSPTQKNTNLYAEPASSPTPSPTPKPSPTTTTTASPAASKSASIATPHASQAGMLMTATPSSTIAPDQILGTQSEQTGDPSGIEQLYARHTTPATKQNIPALVSMGIGAVLLLGAGGYFAYDWYLQRRKH